MGERKRERQWEELAAAVVTVVNYPYEKLEWDALHKQQLTPHTQNIGKAADRQTWCLVESDWERARVFVSSVGVQDIDRLFFYPVSLSGFGINVCVCAVYVCVFGGLCEWRNDIILNKISI